MHACANFMVTVNCHRFKILWQVCKAFTGLVHIHRVKVITVGMGDKNMFNLCQVNTIRYSVPVGIAREVQQKLVIHQSLGAGAYLSAVQFPCALADFAGTVDCRNAFCRGGT